MICKISIMTTPLAQFAVNLVSAPVVVGWVRFEKGCWLYESAVTYNTGIKLPILGTCYCMCTYVKNIYLFNIYIASNKPSFWKSL